MENKEAEKAQHDFTVRGSNLTNRTNSKCAQLTQWLDVTPLELKLTIEQ